MWMKVDDQLHAHRKTRAVTRSHDEKRRDAAPMGLWVLAGSWSAQNNRDGWIPIDELDRFDDDWESLAKRLVHAGYWWPEDRDGEQGFGFNDWQEWNNPDGASASGSFGNHIRWHVNKGVVKGDCEHCPQEPDEHPEEADPIAPISGATRPDDRPDIAPESGGESGGESLRDHRPESLTRTRPDPTRTQAQETSRASALEATDRFDEFWNTYDRKVERKKAQAAYRVALKKPGVTEDLLIASAAAYIVWQTSEGKHPQFTKHPTRWLQGECWKDELPARQAQRTRVQEHLALVQSLGGPQPPTPFQLGGPA